MLRTFAEAAAEYCAGVEKRVGQSLGKMLVLGVLAGAFIALSLIHILEDGLDAVSDDLSEVEEALYEMDEDDEELDDDAEYFETTCPVCQEEIVFDEDTLDSGEIRCPNCGEKLEFDLSDLAQAEDDYNDED